MVYTDLNPCEGAERLKLITMQALSQNDIKFDLTLMLNQTSYKLKMHMTKNWLLLSEDQKI
jgi:hypothetical protein